jgi:hypothetical protein
MITAMIKSTHVSFPRGGIALHVSVEDAIACGINPGEPAVVEVTIRDHTVDEWIAEASSFETEAAALSASSETDSDSPVATAEPIAGGTVEDHPRISWRSETKPTASAAGDEPTRISWRTTRELA